MSPTTRSVTYRTFAALVLSARSSSPPGPRILGSRSVFYPETEHVMGWDIGSHGFEIVLGPEVAAVVEQYLGDDVTNFLAAHDLNIGDVGAWVSHPGGPKVIEAITATLGLSDDALELTWRSTFCHGIPVGTKMTSSRPNRSLTSLAATR